MASCGDQVPCGVTVVFAACVIRASGTANVGWEPAVVTGPAVSIALTRRVVREHGAGEIEVPRKWARNTLRHRLN